MSSSLIVALTAGLLIGLAPVAAVAGVRRGHPDLAEALAALDERVPLRTQSDRRPVLALMRRLPGAVPHKDLAILDWDRDRFLLGRAGAAVLYGMAGPSLAVLLALLDTGLPITVPAGFTLVGALVGWTGYTRRIEQRADAARAEMRFAVVSYLQQVSLLRRGGAGVATALTLPAQLLDDSWAMRRIRHELDHAERAGEMPWEGLRRLGEQTDVSELADLSSIATTAGQDGGAVIDTLLARAESLHDELLADEHEDARRASGQMSTPGALQVFLIAAWVLYPTGVALLTT